MKYCKTCLRTDTLPGILFHKDGVCAACRFQEEFHYIDWNERKAALKANAEWAKKTSKGFDCVVGVSGGKDSTFQSFYARDTLGLKPLLVNCAPNNITEVGQYNLENLVQHGFDMISFRPNPKVMKASVCKGFYKYGNPLKPTEYPLFAVSFQTALRFEIPLLVLGENIAINTGVVKSIKPGGDATDIRHHNTIGGGNASDWIQEGIDLKDLLFYQFPDEEETRKKVKSIWLGYYLKEWSQAHNTQFAIEHGLKGRADTNPYKTGRLNPYIAVDDDTQIVNQMIKYYKYGVGMVTGEVWNLIREGTITREEAIELVEKYDGNCDESYIQAFCQYIDIMIQEFWKVVDGFVNKELFQRDPITNKWIRRFKVGFGLLNLEEINDKYRHNVCN